MANLNRVELIGNLAADPEEMGSACKFRVMVNERFKDKQGQWQSKAIGITCVAFRNLAQLCLEYLEKGRLVYVEGRLDVREYEGKWYTDVVARDVQFLSGKPTSEPKKKVSKYPSGYAEEQKEEVIEDDLPF